MRLDELIRRLRANRICAHLTQPELRSLALAGEIKTLPAGAPLAQHEGQLVVLLEGQAEVTQEIEGERQWMRRVEEGAVLNELSFLGGSRTSESAHAHGDAKVFVLGRRTYVQMVKRGDPVAGKLGLAIAGTVAARLDDRNSALLRILRQHEALLESMDEILTNPETQARLFGERVEVGAAPAPAGDFAAFKQEILDRWDD